MLSLCDIHPLSEFQEEAQAFLEKFKESKTPIILTVDGKAAAVVQDAESYQQLLNRIELLESIAGIRTSMEEFDKGGGMPLNKAFEQFQQKYDIPD